MVKQCPQCKTINPNANMFCVGCGTSLAELVTSTPVQATTIQSPQRVVRPRRKLFFGLAGGLVLLIAGAAIAYVYLFPSTAINGTRPATVTVKELTALSGHSKSVNTLSWSNDGKILASGAKDGTIRLWNATGQLISTFTTGYDDVIKLKWSPDSNVLVSISIAAKVANCDGYPCPSPSTIAKASCGDIRNL